MPSNKPTPRQLKKKEEAADLVIEYLDKFFIGEETDDLPHELDLDIDAFHAHKDNWKLWRALGHHVDGSWVAPVSFLEAQQMPKEMLDVFMALDSVMGKMERQYADMKAKQDKENA